MGFWEFEKPGTGVGWAIGSHLTLDKALHLRGLSILTFQMVWVVPSFSDTLRLCACNLYWFPVCAAAVH